MALVNLATAKDHLRIRHDDRNTDIAVKLEQASAIVLNYLKDQADAGWSIPTGTTGSVAVPGNVEAATLLVLGHLDRHLGDDMYTDEALWAAVGRLLVSFRDPALA